LGELQVILCDYFEVNKDGMPISDPFCSCCWDSEEKQIFLITPHEDNDNYHKCPKCNVEYGNPVISIG
jgi:hypothetical protein